MPSEATTTKDRERSENRAWIAELVRRFQAGEDVEGSFELLFKRYEPAVRRHLARRGWRGAALEDLVQDVMIRVYRGMATFRLESSLDTWILSVMRNTENNAHRDRHTDKAKTTTRAASLDSLLDKEAERGPSIPEPESPNDGPLDDALAHERKARLAAALENLPARMRQCLLFRYHGLRYHEIAAAQGVSVATVKKQIAAGHKRLRPILGPFVELFTLFLLFALLLTT